MSGLKPCPFCGEPDDLEFYNPDEGEMFVYCSTCRACGPSNQIRDINGAVVMAKNLWNRVGYDADIRQPVKHNHD